VGHGERRNEALGRFGETMAAAHYRGQGYEVLERNWRCKAGEIDLICARGALLVVCEVKARTGSLHGHPLEAVTTPKQRRLRRLAAIYLQQQPRRWADVRFDVAAVLDGILEVLEGAF
jgi:putative endonuclease